MHLHFMMAGTRRVSSSHQSTREIISSVSLAGNCSYVVFLIPSGLVGIYPLTDAPATSLIEWHTDNIRLCQLAIFIRIDRRAREVVPSAKCQQFGSRGCQCQLSHQSMAPIDPRHRQSSRLGTFNKSLRARLFLVRSEERRVGKECA